MASSANSSSNSLFSMVMEISITILKLPITFAKFATGKKTLIKEIEEKIVNEAFEAEQIAKAVEQFAESVEHVAQVVAKDARKAEEVLEEVQEKAKVVEEELDSTVDNLGELSNNLDSIAKKIISIKEEVNTPTESPIKKNDEVVKKDLKEPTPKDLKEPTPNFYRLMLPFELKIIHIVAVISFAALARYLKLDVSKTSLNSITQSLQDYLICKIISC